METLCCKFRVVEPVILNTAKYRKVAQVCLFRAERLVRKHKVALFWTRYTVIQMKTTCNEIYHFMTDFRNFQVHIYKMKLIIHQ